MLADIRIQKLGRSVSLYPNSIHLSEKNRQQEQEITFKNISRSNYTRCLRKRNLSLPKMGLPLLLDLSTSPISLCLALFVWTLSRPSAQNSTDRPPAFLRSRRRVSWTSNRCERNHYSRLHLQAAGRGDPPAPWPRTGEGGEYHQHPPSVEGWLVDKGINWLHHGQVPVLGHYIAVSDTAALLGRSLLPDSNLF